jgi:hypothetical protein
MFTKPAAEKSAASTTLHFLTIKHNFLIDDYIFPPYLFLSICNYERNFLDSNAAYPFGVDITNYASLIF